MLRWIPSPRHRTRRDVGGVFYTAGPVPGVTGKYLTTSAWAEVRCSVVRAVWCSVEQCGEVQWVERNLDRGHLFQCCRRSEGEKVASGAKGGKEGVV